MRERIYITVADYCLIEAIKKFNDSGCDGIELGKVDNNWLVSYYKEPVECYQDTMSHRNQDDELEQNETKLTKEELEKEAEEYINIQRNLITQKGNHTTKGKLIMNKQIPKNTVLIRAELKGSCYEEERYCNSFSPNDKNLVEHFWNDPRTYLCIAFDDKDNDIGDNQND